MSIYKQVYEIDEQGFIKEIYVWEFDHAGNPIEELPDNFIPIDPPHGLYRARWTGEEWVEDMSQEEIDEIRNQPVPLTDTEVLGQQMTEREIEAMEQGQQITDMDIRLMTLEMEGSK